jgi:predicted O-methyltransferase YrrM
MRSIKSLARKARSGKQAIQKVQAFSALENIDFRSGLGDCAFLLYGLVKSIKPRVVVEIGSARGRSACFMGMALKENGSGKLYAIDPHVRTAWNDDESVETYGCLVENIDKCDLQDFVQIVRDNSEGAGRNWSTPIDVLFIDGDHSYAGVKRDWELFAPHVQPFGVTIFHDTLWDLRPDPRYSRPDMGVPTFVEELRAQGYPVITLDKNFGVSLVQPVRCGVSLSSPSKGPLEIEELERVNN